MPTSHQSSYSPNYFRFCSPNYIITSLEHIGRPKQAAGQDRRPDQHFGEERVGGVAEEAAEILHWSSRQCLPGPAREMVFSSPHAPH